MFSAAVGTGAAVVVSAAVFSFLLLSNHSKRKKNEKHLERTVVLVGASSGIGRDLALIYGKQRIAYNLVLVARRAELLELLKEEIEMYRMSRTTSHYKTGKVTCIVADICTADGIAKIRDAIDNLDFLVLNAATTSCLSVEELAVRPDSSDIIRTIFETNVYAPIHVTLDLIDKIKESKTSIVVVSSVAGKVGAPTRSLYASSKHALNGFFNSLRMELEKYGVSVSLMYPGTVITEFRKSAVELQNQTKDEIDNNPRVDMTSGIKSYDCAIKIFEAAENKKRETWIPFWYWAVMPLELISPSSIDKFAQRKYHWNH